jgi:molybdenum cofactor cytidylyltransferase
MSPARTFALVPAAGRSSRMGRPKLLLPVAGRTVLEHVIAGFRSAGIEAVLVVLARDAPEELVRMARAAGAEVLTLSDQTADMRATIEQGLTWLEQHCHPDPEDGWLLAPADHPTLDPAVVRQLLEAREAEPAASLFLPTFEGRRGHPALLGWRHVAAIRQLPEGQGLNVYLRAQEGQTRLVPVSSADILCDLDTPEDYARLLGN